MPQCSELGLMLGAVEDGELEPDAVREVSHHLERCASCAGEICDYSTIGRELRALAVIPSLEGFTKSVLDAIAKIVVVAVLAVALHDAFFPSTGRIAKAAPEAVASRHSTSSGAARSSAIVDVRVDSAFIAGTDFRSLGQTNGRTEPGKMIVFRLQDGKTLHVRPRAVVGNMIAMEVVLFDGKRTTMTADLKLESGDTFTLSGEQYGDGTLLIRISPTTPANASRGPDYSDRSPAVRAAQAS